MTNIFIEFLQVQDMSSFVRNSFRNSCPVVDFVSFRLTNYNYSQNYSGDFQFVKNFKLILGSSDLFYELPYYDFYSGCGTRSIYKFYLFTSSSYLILIIFIGRNDLFYLILLYSILQTDLLSRNFGNFIVQSYLVFTSFSKTFLI